MITAIATASQVAIVSPAYAKHVARIEMIRAASHKTPKSVATEAGTVTVSDIPEADIPARLNAEAKFASMNRAFRAIWAVNL